MASMTMTASFLAGSASTITGPSTARRSLTVAKAASGAAPPPQGEKGSLEMKRKSSNEAVESSSSSGRRDLMFAAAAMAACSIAKVAKADEPKRGTKEAKEKYAPVCVTMPTARICRN